MAVEDYIIPSMSGLFQTGLSAVGQGRANVRNERLVREQMQWQEKMMDKQNAYNTPAMQMQRFRNAGLNPNLIYGQMSPQFSAGVSGVSPAQNQNAFGGADFSSIASIPSILQQRRLSDSTIELQDANAENLREQAEGQRLDNIIKGYEAGDWQRYRSYFYKNQDKIIQRIDQEISESKEYVNLLKSQTDYTDQQALSMFMNNVIIDRAKEYIVEKYRNDADLSGNMSLYYSRLAAIQYSVEYMNLGIGANAYEQSKSWLSIRNLNGTMREKLRTEIMKNYQILPYEADKMIKEIEYIEALRDKAKSDKLTEDELRTLRKWDLGTRSFMQAMIGTNQGVQALDTWFGSPNTKKEQMLKIAGRKQSAGKPSKK